MKRLPLIIVFILLNAHSSSWGQSKPTTLGDVARASELGRIAELFRDNTISAAVIAERIAARLDALTGATDVTSLKEKAPLVRFAAQGYIATEQDAVRAKMRQPLKLYADAPFSANADGRQLLHLAAGMIGLPIDQKSVIAFVKGNQDAPALRIVAMEAILGQEVLLPEIARDLELLTQDDWHFWDYNDFGSAPGKEVYPIRERAVKALARLRAQILTASPISEVVQGESP